MSEQRLPAWITEHVPKELVDSTLFKFRVILPKDRKSGEQRSIEVNMLPDLDLDSEILVQQMHDMPAQYAYWAAVYSEVRTSVALTERTLKARRGQVVEQIQKEAADRKVKLTDNQVKTIAEADAKLMEADRALAHLQKQAGKLYHMLEALKMKAELARSLAGFKKQEYATH